MKILISILISFLFLSLAVPSFSKDVVLAWDPNTEEDLEGYRLYWGTASGVYDSFVNVGNVTTYTLNLSEGTLYYIALTAYDEAQNESGYSNEVTANLIPLSEVTNAKAEVKNYRP